MLSKDNKFHIPFYLGGSQIWKVLVVYIPTDENLAKIFTKALAKVKFQHFVKLLRLHTIQSNDHVKGSVEVL